MEKPKQAKNDFNLVVENAFDFFRKSLEEFDKEPKYSIIHFHAAVELIMKARLLWEHWTLIITRPETANLKSFRSGDFQSISIKDAKARLESIVQDGLNQAEYECFLRLSDHRNRMVHFYHPGNTGNKTELEKIVAEQCLAWPQRLLKRPATTRLQSLTLRPPSMHRVVAGPLEAMVRRACAHLLEQTDNAQDEGQHGYDSGYPRPVHTLLRNPQCLLCYLVGFLSRSCLP